MSNYLLDRVSYALRPPRDVKGLDEEILIVSEAFPYNPDSKTTPLSAKRWAEMPRYFGKSSQPARIIDRANDPFDITIVHLEHRGEGGRAYKVMDDDMRLFDLREDQLVEAIRDVGILPGGRIPGKFVWGITGSQMHMVLVGGKLCDQMVQEAKARKEFAAAKKSGLHPTEGSLVPGRIYSKRDKTIHAFLGRVKRDKKVFYAFIPLPQRMLKPHDLSENVYGYSESYINHLKAVNEFHASWDDRTWSERCDFTWQDYGGRSYLPSIVLAASPKFEADVGAIEPELLKRFRDGVEKHNVVNGYGESILAKEFKAAHPNVPGYLAADDTWVTHYRTDEAQRMTAAWRAAKASFYKSFSWDAT